MQGIRLLSGQEYLVLIIRDIAHNTLICVCLLCDDEWLCFIWNVLNHTSLYDNYHIPVWCKQMCEMYGYYQHLSLYIHIISHSQKTKVQSMMSAWTSYQVVPSRWMYYYNPPIYILFHIFSSSQFYIYYNLLLFHYDQMRCLPMTLFDILFQADVACVWCYDGSAAIKHIVSCLSIPLDSPNNLTQMYSLSGFTVSLKMTVLLALTISNESISCVVLLGHSWRFSCHSDWSQHPR